jgi:hypothetical protein
MKIIPKSVKLQPSLTLLPEIKEVHIVGESRTDLSNALELFAVTPQSRDERERFTNDVILNTFSRFVKKNLDNEFIQAQAQIIETNGLGFEGLHPTCCQMLNTLLQFSWYQENLYLETPDIYQKYPVKYAQRVEQFNYALRTMGELETHIRMLENFPDITLFDYPQDVYKKTDTLGNSLLNTYCRIDDLMKGLMLSSKEEQEYLRPVVTSFLFFLESEMFSIMKERNIHTMLDTAPVFAAYLEEIAAYKAGVVAEEEKKKKEKLRKKTD